MSNPLYSPPNSKSSDRISNDWLPPSTTNRSLCRKYKACGRVYGTLQDVDLAQRSGKNERNRKRTPSDESPVRAMVTWKSGMD